MKWNLGPILVDEVDPEVAQESTTNEAILVAQIVGGCHDDTCENL